MFLKNYFLLILLLLLFTSCENKKSCKSILDCGKNEVCKNSECVIEGLECETFTDCEDSETCLNNKCVDSLRLCDNFSCDNGVCRVQSQKPVCFCNRGYVKENNKCVVAPCSENKDCQKKSVCMNTECVDEIILCKGQLCSNHGECKVNARRAYCECEDNFFNKGMDCLEDKCKDVQCEQYEVCNTETGKCERNVDPCEGINCGEHGECEFDENDNASCKCEKGYEEKNLKCIFKVACTPDPQGEICGDGFDNNCDGFAEESCTCDDGDSLECYSGVIGTENIGECKKGTMTCLGGELWTECVGEVIPQEEICDNKDNDCDNTIDKTPSGESLYNKCYSGNESELLVDSGRCKAGKQLCTNGTFEGVTCTGEILPIEEACGNSIDDDCDGLIDEDCVAPIVACSSDISKVYIFGDSVRLSATATDSNGSVVTTNWSFVQKPNGTASELTPITGYNTSFLPDTIGEYIIRFTATDNDGESSYCDIKVNADTRDNLNVHISWNNNADADLYLLGPTGGDWLINSCNWGNVNPHWYDASSSNPHLDRDDVDGFGPEVIQIEIPENGNYTVGVNIFDLGSNSNTEVTVKIKCQNEDFIFTKKLNSSGAWWYVKDIVWENDACTIKDASRN